MHIIAHAEYTSFLFLESLILLEIYIREKGDVIYYQL